MNLILLDAAIANQILDGLSWPLLLVILAAGLLAGYLIRMLIGGMRLRSAERRAETIVQNAIKEAETEKKQRRFEIKDELFKSKADFEKQTRQTREEVRALEKRIQQREESLDRKVDILDKKEEDISRREKDLSARQSDMDKRENKLKRSIEESNRQLQRISGMSRAEAREIYLSRMEDELKHEAAAMIHRVESEAREKAEKEAQNIIALAAQRCASDYVSESTVSTVTLPNDEMKGRIIGREGRNIRALEAATGIDIIIDDTPEAVVLSGFDAVRKEIARISLERLMIDGRIHPARIEEVVEKVKSEVEKTMKEAGERAAFDTGIHNLHPEIIKLLGRLKFRTSYGQNVLHHSIEVADLVGVMAAELGLDVKLAKRIGFLHDIGKATTHEVEGPHAQIGADLARRYREKPIVVNGIAAHHMETDAQSIFAVLVQAGDSLSAARPGARAETLAIYMKRLEKLEEIANSFNGIEKAYAIQAGREIRVIVEPGKVNDDETVLLARNLSRKIEEDMEYPGQVKITIIRETRAVEYAR